MNFDDPYVDEYEVYEELFDPSKADRHARRRRKPKARHVPKKSRAEIIDELTDEMTGLEGGFRTSYQPSRYEEKWLLSSLRTFYDRGLISDVLALVKGGKEASVYRCQGLRPSGADIVAAKVYRPRKFRNLRNDKLYRQGRALLNALGNDHDYARDQRVIRALNRKSAFGFQVQHTSWLMHEYTALERLYQAGGAVPRPIAAGENGILMSYHGDARIAAPTLNQISLAPGEAEPLFQEVLRNVALMLQQGLVHGDLSAYNILYWAGEITLIDFPQVTDLHGNDQAYAILRRDIQRVCEYFGRQGVECDPQATMDEFWYLYGYGDP